MEGDREEMSDEYLISDVETWRLTHQLRWAERNDLDYQGNKTLLQQLWISSQGKQEWRDVPVHRELLPTPIEKVEESNRRQQELWERCLRHFDNQHYL
jgi:hypothetical protein